MKEIRSLALNIEPITYKKQAPSAPVSAEDQVKSVVDSFASANSTDDLIGVPAAEPVLASNSIDDKE